MGRQETAAAITADELEQLRLGHGLLSPQQFRNALLMHDIEIWPLPHRQFALMAWGDSADGRVANILTTVGSMEHAADGLREIEYLAKTWGARAVMSVGRPGWTRLVQDMGYTVAPCILMKKVL